MMSAHCRTDTQILDKIGILHLLNCSMYQEHMELQVVSRHKHITRVSSFSMTKLKGESIHYTVHNL